MNNGAGAPARPARKASRIAARPGVMSHGTSLFVNAGKYDDICKDKASITPSMASG
jgi:hypothetical protein